MAYGEGPRCSFTRTTGGKTCAGFYLVIYVFLFIFLSVCVCIYINIYIYIDRGIDN
jgi:hypothetical protein